MLFTAMSSHVLIVFLLYMLKRKRFLLMWCRQLNLTPLNHLWKTIVVHIHHALPQVQRAILLWMILGRSHCSIPL